MRRRLLAANQNEGRLRRHHHDEDHGQWHAAASGHMSTGHGEYGHFGGCCGHHGHGGCHHAKHSDYIFAGPLETNCYIYVSGNECMMDIDPGASGAEIAASF